MARPLSHPSLALLLVPLLVSWRTAGATTITTVSTIGELGCVKDAPACAIDASYVIESGSILDFGDSAVTLKQGQKLDVVAGSMTLHARSLTLEPSAALLARGGTDQTGDIGGSITVQTTGDLRIQASRTGRARIDASAQSLAGTITLSVGGALELDGVLAAQGTTALGSGNTIRINATGGVTIADKSQIVTASGSQGEGGDVNIAAGAFVASGPIDAHGGDQGGGITITSRDGIVTTDAAIFDASSTLELGTGGDAFLEGGGDVTVGGMISTAGTGTDGELSSDGGSITIHSTGGDVIVSAQLRLFGSAPDGTSGDLDLLAIRDVVQTGAVAMNGHGPDASGGTLTVDAGRNATLGPIDVSGGSGQDGEVMARAVGTLTVPAEIDADGNGGFGGTLTFDADTVQVTGNVHADGPGDGDGGNAILRACTLTFGATGQLSTRPTTGTNLLQASGPMSLPAGSELLAGTFNRLEYRAAHVPVLAGTIDPAPILFENPNLPLCAGEHPANCGDGILDPDEECDDGNTTNCDGCSANCQKEAGVVCGDGIVNLACGEQCDDGNTTSCDGCQGDCKRHDAVCGDGILECGEQCDDGNTTSCDKCSANCRIDNVCGDGIVECGEQCDDGSGNGAPGHTCDATCQTIALPTCGDGHIDAGEECDDGNTRDCDGCSHTCHREICGNNVVDCHEQCDDANRDSCDGCSHTCQIETCGNGVVDCGEECDDGNTTDGDSCDSNCTVPRCGNGVRAGLEQCDDGNQVSGDGCTDTCQIEVPCPDGVTGFICTQCDTDRDCDPSGQCGGKQCVAHACIPVTPFACSAPNTCVLDAAGAPECVHLCFNAAACSDGNACNGAELCTQGRCAPGPALDCNDHDSCTDDSCDPLHGCQHAPKTEFDAVDCHLQTFDAAVAAASATDLSPVVGRKLAKARAAADAKLAAALSAAQGHVTKRERKQLVAAKARLRSLQKLVGTAQAKGKVGDDLGVLLAQSANGATDAVGVLLGELTPAGH